MSPPQYLLNGEQGWFQRGLHCPCEVLTEPCEANTAGFGSSEASAGGHTSVHPDLAEPSAVVSLRTEIGRAGSLALTH